MNRPQQMAMAMEQDAARPGSGLAEWLARIDPRYRAVWAGRPEPEQRALALYFLPHRSALPMLAPTRPRLIKWYCPFAAQSEFPTGHRYCINVYAGCAHGCVYCYAAAYEPDTARSKANFARLLAKDLEDLERFDVPPAPVHLSNSTDPFQRLEADLGQTRRVLEGLQAHRHRFTTVTVLTKNPSLASRPEYLALLKALGHVPSGHPATARWQQTGQPPLQVEVSLAFWREAARAFWDPGAPTITERLAGVHALRQAGIPVVLRIDPLFPRSPLRDNPELTLARFGLVEAQTLDDLEQLVEFARQVDARHIVYSAAKIVVSRRRASPEPMRTLRAVYAALADPMEMIWKGGSWRLPPAVSEQWVVQPFLRICHQHGVPAKFCMRNLLETC